MYHTILSKIEMKLNVVSLVFFFLFLKTSIIHISISFPLFFYDMHYFVCRFDGGSNIVGFHNCFPNNETCPLSYRLNNDVGEGDVVDIDSLSRTSGRSYFVNYSTNESMSVYFVMVTKSNR